jgi:hypothetical protein
MPSGAIQPKKRQKHHHPPLTQIMGLKNPSASHLITSTTPRSTPPKIRPLFPHPPPRKKIWSTLEE